MVHRSKASRWLHLIHCLPAISYDLALHAVCPPSSLGRAQFPDLALERRSPLFLAELRTSAEENMILQLLMLASRVSNLFRWLEWHYAEQQSMPRTVKLHRWSGLTVEISSNHKFNKRVHINPSYVCDHNNITIL